MIAVRTLRSDEAMPEGLNTGFEKHRVMKEWVWVAEEGEVVHGVLMAAPCHGLVYLVRLCVTEAAPECTVLFLLREFLAECKKRRFKGYITHINPMLEIERRLIPLCKRAGGTQVAMPQVAIIGRIEDAVRF